MKSLSCFLLCTALLLGSLFAGSVPAHAAFFRHAAPVPAGTTASGNSARAVAATGYSRTHTSFWSKIRKAPFERFGKSQAGAILLCFFFGALGAHRFYMGYTWQGVLQFFTFGGLGIWSLIDFIRLLTGDLQPKHSGWERGL